MRSQSVRLSLWRIARLLGVAVFLATPIAILLALWHDEAYHDPPPFVADTTPLGPDNPPSADSFDPQQVIGPLAPITDIPTLSAQEAGEKIEDSELVLGVVVNGAARAYPINMMTGPSREVFNDTLGGQPIAATW